MNMIKFCKTKSNVAGIKEEFALHVLFLIELSISSICLFINKYK